MSFQTLCFPHFAKTEVQQSLLDEENEKLQREIERQKKEIQDMRKKLDEMMKITEKIMECRPPPKVYAMRLKE